MNDKMAWEKLESASKDLNLLRRSFERLIEAVRNDSIKDIRSFWSEKGIDALFLASDFLQLYPSERENDLSDKLAWYLRMGFVKDQNRRATIQRSLISELYRKLRYDHLPNPEKEKYPAEPLFNKCLNLEREEHHSFVNRRSDIVITENEGGYVNMTGPIIGIEVKIDDTNYVKSEEAFRAMRTRDYVGNQNIHYWMIMPVERYENYLSGSDHEGENEWGEEGNEQIQLKSIPILTWTDVCLAIRRIIDRHTILNCVDPYLIFSEMFLSAIETQVLSFDLPKFADILDNDDTQWNLNDLIRFIAYFQYRKEDAQYA
jgi:hypothetical protein